VQTGSGEPPRVSGVIVKVHLEALSRRLGADVFDRILAKLSAADRDELTLVTPLSWVRFSIVERLYEDAAAARGTTVEELHTEIASRVTGQAITTIWRALLRVVTDEMLISRSPSLFKKAYPQGALEIVKSGKGFAELRVVDWPQMNDFAVRGLRLGIESTLRSAGRRDPKGTARRTPDGALLRFEWSH
jgi:hypothetical protein